MIMLPCFSEYLTFILDLFLDVITQLLQSSLEFILECIQGGMHIVHLVYCLLFVLLNLTRDMQYKVNDLNREKAFRLQTDTYA